MLLIDFESLELILFWDAIRTARAREPTGSPDTLASVDHPYNGRFSSMANSQNGARAITDHIFTNLLASAYSLQQRQDRLKSRVSASKSNELMSAVLETQGLVWHHSVHPETAMQLIASRSQKLCGAAGAAIGLVDGESLEYKVAIGIAVTMLDFKILADSSFSFQQLRSQPVIESSTWQDKALGTRLMANSILSVPIHRKGELAGCIQLFSRVGQFGEESVYTCELMSSILTQLIEETEFCGNGHKEDVINLRSPDPEHKSLAEPCQDRLNLGSPQLLQQSQHSSDLLFGSTNRNISIDQALSANGNDMDPHGEIGPPARNLASRAKTMFYPVVVLLFVATANIFAWGHGWPLEVATIIILIFTAVELTKR